MKENRLACAATSILLVALPFSSSGAQELKLLRKLIPPSVKVLIRDHARSRHDVSRAKSCEDYRLEVSHCILIPDRQKCEMQIASEVPEGQQCSLTFSKDISGCMLWFDSQKIAASRKLSLMRSNDHSQPLNIFECFAPTVASVTSPRL